MSCGGGNQTSYRTCIGGLPGEEGCLGEEKRFQVRHNSFNALMIIK